MKNFLKNPPTHSARYAHAYTDISLCNHCVGIRTFTMTIQ